MNAIGRTHFDFLEATLEDAIAHGSEQLNRALLTASMIGDDIKAASLLDRGAEIDATDSGGRTPLIEAAFGGHLETVHLLLNRGADINAADATGWTPLMEAASKGRIEIVRLLVSAGANPAAVSKSGWTALNACKANPDLLRVLRSALTR